jgi:hypothetical protein
MDDLARFAHERACIRLISGFTRALDLYDYDSALRFWAKDGVLALPGQDHVGHAALRDWMNRREKDMVCRHVVTNVLVDVHDDQTATATALCSTWRVRGWRGREPAPMMLPAYVVDYSDTFIRNPEHGWLFARRVVTIALAGVEQRQALRV